MSKAIPAPGFDTRICDLPTELRREIHFALMERRETLQDLAKKSEKAHTPHPTAARLELLYGDSEVYDDAKARNVTIPGLVSLFAPPEPISPAAKDQVDAFDNADGKKPKRDRKKKGDDGAEAGEPGTGFADKYGNLHATAALAAEANEKPDPAIDHGTPAAPAEGSSSSDGIGAEPASSEGEGGARVVLALAEGSGETMGQPVDVDFEIVDDGAKEDPATGIRYNANNRCVGCRVPRDEPHDPTCAEVARVSGTSAAAPAPDIMPETREEGWDEPQRMPAEPGAPAIGGLEAVPVDPLEAIRAQAANAKPSASGPIPVDLGTAAP